MVLVFRCSPVTAATRSREFRKRRRSASSTVWHWERVQHFCARWRSSDKVSDSVGLLSGVANGGCSGDSIIGIVLITLATAMFGFNGGGFNKVSSNLLMCMNAGLSSMERPYDTGTLESFETAAEGQKTPLWAREG